MPEEHWFDALNKALVHDTPRRAVLTRALALAFGFSLASDVAAIEAKKPKHKKAKRKRKKRKPKDKPRPRASCSGGACAREWAGNGDEIEYCEFICAQCDGNDPREFCILKPTGGDPVAWCCDEGQTCCDNWCCGGLAGESCCDPGRGRPRRCINEELLCCPDDPGSGVCDLATHLCCQGIGCVSDLTDPNHCGGCNRPCPTGTLCVDGDCRCPPNRVHWACPGRDRMCIPDASYVCCDGFSCSVGQNDPGDYVCCGHTPIQGYCVPSSQGGCFDQRFEPYPPHDTRTYGEA